jgi:hypothetical protein
MGGRGGFDYLPLAVSYQRSAFSDVNARARIEDVEAALRRHLAR